MRRKLLRILRTQGEDAWKKETKNNVTEKTVFYLKLVQLTKKT